jgi:hypothetical protein
MTYRLNFDSFEMAFREPRPPPRAAAGRTAEAAVNTATFQKFALYADYLRDLASGSTLTSDKLQEIEKKIAQFQTETAAILGPLYNPPSPEYPGGPPPGKPKPPPRIGAFRVEGS